MITKAPEKTGDKWLDLLAALRSDLEHAEQGVDEATALHIRAYNRGYHDAIKQVIDLVERTVAK